MLGDDDLALGVFTDAEIATVFRRVRPGVPDVDIAGIFGLDDDDALQGRALAAQRRLRVVGLCDVRPDDVLHAATAVPALGLAAGAQLRVIGTPRRVVDGSEMDLLLGSIAP
jgi:hypothetical protein